MTAKVRFLSEEPRAEIRSALAVPRTAIVNDGSGPAVFLVDQGKAKRMPVELARAGSRPAPPPSGSFSARSGGPEVAAAPPAADPFVELTTGPPEGAFVIDSPPAKLVAGSPVRIAP
jgi:hypothetical protein